MTIRTGCRFRELNFHRSAAGVIPATAALQMTAALRMIAVFLTTVALRMAARQIHALPATRATGVFRMTGATHFPMIRPLRAIRPEMALKRCWIMLIEQRIVT